MCLTVGVATGSRLIVKQELLNNVKNWEKTTHDIHPSVMRKENSIYARPQAWK